MKLNRCSADVVDITLSRRNLLALLHKLDWEASARCIYKELDGRVVFVRCEDDDQAYSEQSPGAMHSLTEEFIAAQ